MAFKSALLDSRNEWASVLDALSEAPISTQRIVSKDAFFRLAVSWEVFRSDWHIAAVAKDTSVLARTFRSDIEKLVKAKSQLKGAVPYLKIDMPKHLPLSDVREAIEPDGGNVKLKPLGDGSTTNLWPKQAEAQLSSPFSEVIEAIPLRDWKFLSLVERLRDCIAHSSRRSVETLGAAFAALDPADEISFGFTLRGLGMPRVPIYLHGRANGSRRMDHFYDRFGLIADALIV